MKTEIIYIIIAILALIILVNLNVKEGFSDTFNTTYVDISLNETKKLILDNLTIYKNNYLTDFNNIFTSKLTASNITLDPNNIYGDGKPHNFTSAYIDSGTGENQIIDINRFENYTYAYRTQPPNTIFPTVPNMTMTINNTTVVNETLSYIAIFNIIQNTQRIINGVTSRGIFTNYNNSDIPNNATYTQTDINDYKMIYLTNFMVTQILESYDKLNDVLITTSNNTYTLDNIIYTRDYTDISYTNTSGTNLITKHEAIINSIRQILYQLASLLLVCYPYFNNTAGSNITNNISKLNINTKDGYKNIGGVFEEALNSDEFTTITTPYNNLF